MDSVGLYENTPISKAYFKMSVPLVLSLTVTIIYGLVDMYFVSMTGDVNLISGVSLVAPIYSLLLAFGDIVGYGGASLISQHIGKKDYQQTKQISSFSFWFSLIFGVIVSIVFLLCKGTALRLLGADPSTFAHAQSYYIWIVLSAPAVLIYCAFLNITRSDGKAKGAMLCVLVGTIVNLILDPIFIFRLDMGAEGASLSTFIGMSIEAAGCVIIGTRKSAVLSVSAKYLKLEKAIIGKMISIGYSSSMSNAMQTLMLLITNRYLVKYSTEAVSAMGVAQKVISIAFLLVLGFAMGGQPLMGYAYGQGDTDKVRRIFRYQLKFCLTISLILTFIILLFAPQILSSFTDNPTLISLGGQMVRIQYITAICQAFILCVFSLGIAVGDALIPFTLSLSRQGVVFVAVIIILAGIFGYYGVLMAQPAADLITAALALALLKKIIYAKKLK